ncbi:calcium uniporter protein, mitochondrial [Centruroides vittatus]|uniref:calcium uniporter protein, mitochondrial n=1 Tax=Centruroides vittatus TaxID=120091 RepID=UPI00350FC07A
MALRRSWRVGWELKCCSFCAAQRRTLGPPDGYQKWKSTTLLLFQKCSPPITIISSFTHTHNVDLVHGEVTVIYQRGLPVITVPLPSRREKCCFTLRPISSTVGDFLRDIQSEDRGIDRIGIHTTDGIRIASSTSIESLMQNDFHLIVNDIVYYVSPPEAGKLTSEEMQTLWDVKSQVARLYEVLHVDQFQLERERKLLCELELLKQELEPLEAQKEGLMSEAKKRTTILSWLGLGLMGVQFGILARLTWWEYSWDIMEPVTYFITYGTTMAMYAYFVLTRQEYYLPDVCDRQSLKLFHKTAGKTKLNVQKYNELKNEIALIEDDLKRLRDPMHLHLPIKEPTKFKFKDNENSS